MRKTISPVVRTNLMGILIVLMSLAFVGGVFTLSVYKADTYVSGYQGIVSEFKGVYIGEAKGQDTCWHGYTGDTIYFDSRTDNGTFLNDKIDYLYTDGDKTRWVRIYNSDWYLPSVVDIKPTYFKLDIDDIKRGTTDLIGSLEVPQIDRSVRSIAKEFAGQYQSETVPYNIYTWEWTDESGVKHRFRIDEYILVGKFGVGCYPNDRGEYRSAVEDMRVWIKFVPNRGDYFRSVEGAELVNCVFGIAQIEVANKDIHNSNGWTPCPMTNSLVVGQPLAMYADMNYTDIGYDWEGAQQYEGYYLNPQVFSKDGWYVAFPFDRQGVWDSDSLLTGWLLGSDVKGSAVNVDYEIHAFVVGEWKVAQEYDVKWEGMEPFAIHRKGLIDYVKDFASKLINFIKSPLGIAVGIILLILFILLLVLTTPAIMGCCMMGAGAEMMAQGRESKRMLDIIRKFRDMYVGKYMRRIYYNILSPPVVFLMKKIKAIAYVVHYCFTYPIFTLTKYIIGGKENV